MRMVSPQLNEQLCKLAAAGAIAHIQRPFEASDLVGIVLTIAATDDPSVNRYIADIAERRGIQVNVVDQPAAGSFICPRSPTGRQSW